MEKIVELSDIEISREEMDKYKIAITHNSDKNTHTIYTYLLERLQINQEQDDMLKKIYVLTKQKEFIRSAKKQEKI